jgi:hypothetical protein
MLDSWACLLPAGAESWEQQDGISFDDALTKYVGECGKGQVRISTGNFICNGQAAVPNLLQQQLWRGAQQPAAALLASTPALCVPDMCAVHVYLWSCRSFCTG